MDLLSFFCGPGGLDEGFRKTGFHTLVATDINEDALATFALNHPKAHVFQSDLLTLSTRAIVERCLVHRKSDGPLGVIGGPPCQSFSVSNVRQTDDDPRSSLPLKYADILRTLNHEVGVSFFVFENVPGLLSPKHAARYSLFKQKFTDAGFMIYERILDAKDFAVPQKRSRVIIVGINSKFHERAKWSEPRRSSKRRTVRDAIWGLPDPVQFRRGLTAEDIPFHPNHWCMAPKSTKFANADLAPGQAWGRSFRTLEWDKPSWSVAYGHREVHVHPDAKRRLSIFEAMLLQSFPKQYELTGTLSAQINQVSNAVPPRLAEAVARSVARTLSL